MYMKWWVCDCLITPQWAGGCWVGSNLFPLEGVNGCCGGGCGGASTSMYKALKVWVGAGVPDILGVGWGSDKFRFASKPIQT